MSAARVYLFADFGKGPRVMHSGVGPEWALGVTEHASDVGMTYDGDPESPRSRAYDMGRNAGERTIPQAESAGRAWWLVECESAEAGRRIIAAVENEGGGGPDGRDPVQMFDGRRASDGRILASGGAR